MTISRLRVRAPATAPVITALLCSLVIVSLAPVVGAGSGAVAAGDRDRTRKISVVAPVRVEGRDVVDVKARVRPARRGARTYLHVWDGASWRVVDRDRQGARGRVRLSLDAPAWGDNYLRVVASGARPVSSKVAVTHVVPRLSAAVAPTVPEGAATVVVARVRPARQGVEVLLQARVDDAWTTVDAGSIDREGRTALSYGPSVPGVHDLRVVSAGDLGDLAELVSGPLLTLVTPRNDVVSRTPDGAPASVPQVYGADLSGDARTVAFATPPTRLTGVAARTSIVVFDRLTRSTSVIPLPPDGIASDPALSYDGRVVAYARGVYDDVEDDAGQQLVVRDRLTGVERVFKHQDSRQGVDISAAGRQVVTVGRTHLFLCPESRTSLAGTRNEDAEITLVDVASGARQCLVWQRPAADENSLGEVRISADGSTVAAIHRWRPRGGGALRSEIEVWRGAQAPLRLTTPDPLLDYLGMSADGRRLVVQTVRVLDNESEIYDVGVWDLDAGGYTSLTDGLRLGASSPTISDDGRSVGFVSFSPELGEGRCHYRRQLATGLTVRMGCEATGDPENSAISSDGTSVLALLGVGDDDLLTVMSQPIG